MMSAARFVMYLMLVLSGTGLLGCATPPAKKTLAAGAGGPAPLPETMTFSAEAEAGPAAAQLGKLLARLEEAQRWDRPLLMSTVAKRLAILLPAACAGWGHVGVFVPPPAPDADPAALDAPVTRFLFVVRESKPIDPDGAEGPEGEPASKKGSKATPGVLVRTCAVLLVRGTTTGRVRIGVMPVHAGIGTPRVLASSAVGDGHLVHLLTDPVTQSGPFTWAPGHLLLLFTHGALVPMGAWPAEADPLPRDWRFAARLQGSTGFGKVVLVLETEAPAEPDAPDTAEPAMPEDSGDPADADAAPEEPDGTPTAAPASMITRCAWVDGQGKLTAIHPQDRAQLVTETGLSGCAATPEPAPEALEEGTEVP